MDDPEQFSDFRSGLGAGKPADRLRRLAGHVTQVLPFDPDAVESHFRLEDHVFLELRPNLRVYSLACAYVSSNGQVESFRYSPERTSDETFDEVFTETLTHTTIGLGIFPFKWRGHDLFALHQTCGQPVGTSSEVNMFTNLVLFANRSHPEVLGNLCHELVLESEKAQTGYFSVFEWQAANQFWAARVICPARPMHTVVLDQGAKDSLLSDLTEFLGQDTRRWYKEHGIQHKRGYLFHGTPGTGKTSLIQAIASHFEHNLCHVHLTHPLLTDESLRAAVNGAPRRSILVFEDVDAIFGKDREKLIADSPLTFSGLLNALDGVGKADGMIFILTTNHRERLNPALIRNGRADVHVEFSHASDEQVEGMFARFYPVSTQQMRQGFVKRMRSALDGRLVTTAALQHFFIIHRQSSATQALDAVQQIVDELDMRADEQKALEEDKQRKKEERNAKVKKT